MSSSRWEDDDPEPGVVGAELDAVALEPHDELLARPDPDVLAARGEVGLRRRDEPVALLHELAPVLRVGDDVLEGAAARTPARGRRTRMLRWRSSSCGGASPKLPRLARFDRRRSCSS